MKDQKEPRDNRTILERITSATQNVNPHLGVAMAEIEQEISRYCAQGDSMSMRQLFSAYCAWEEVGKKQLKSDTDVRTLALENFDGLARIADARTVNKGDVGAILMARTPYPSVGRIQTFFRDTFNYHPKTPTPFRNSTSH